MKRPLLVIIVVVLYVLHQDFWFWRAAHPLIFGFIPVGLFYHAGYSLVSALLMWLLVAQAWPAHLEERLGEGVTGRGGDDAIRLRGETGIADEELRPVAPSPRPPVAPSPHRPVAEDKEGQPR